MFIDQLSNGTSFIDEQQGRVTEFLVMPPGKMAVCCHVASEQSHDGPNQSMTTNDLVVRLRALANGQHDDLSVGAEAADQIERLKAELTENEGVIAVWRRRTIDAEAEVERLTHERDDAAKAERARCMAVIRRLHDLLPTGERKRSKPGLRDALLAIEMLDQFIEAQKTEGRDE